jgi:hypothetical protein
VLGDFRDGDLKVAAFETREQADDYRDDCWATCRAPTTPAIAVPPAFRHDRAALVEFLGAAILASAKECAAPEGGDARPEARGPVL